MNCHICNYEIKCSCINEQHIKLKERSCAMRKSYPISCLKIHDKGARLVHICSRQCDTDIMNTPFFNVVEEAKKDINFVNKMLSISQNNNSSDDDY